VPTPLALTSTRLPTLAPLRLPAAAQAQPDDGQQQGSHP
jgi:hypothetical protein